MSQVWPDDLCHSPGLCFQHQHQCVLPELQLAAPGYIDEGSTQPLALYLLAERCSSNSTRSTLIGLEPLDLFLPQLAPFSWHFIPSTSVYSFPPFLKGKYFILSKSRPWRPLFPLRMWLNRDCCLTHWLQSKPMHRH